MSSDIKTKALYDQYVLNTYGRFPVALTRGEGRRVWDSEGKEYLDFGAGIAVTLLGHSHPEIQEELHRQAGQLTHVSNLYYVDQQGRLAKSIVDRLLPGKCFFCNSGAEANEALFKLARRFGHEEGRYEVITMNGSFHGRTLASIAATGQDKVRQGFGPVTPGFKHVPLNDLKALENTLTEATAAVLLEGVQGEGGIHTADGDYLLALRKICHDRKILLLWDGIQCGYFRTGEFHSFQRILGAPVPEGFFPDAIAMAKSVANGLPMGAVWIDDRYTELLGPGSHGTTFGGTPLVSAVALKVLEIVEREQLAVHATERGNQLKSELIGLQQRLPNVIKEVRGLGLMLGIELHPEVTIDASDQRPLSLQIVEALRANGLLSIPSGLHVFRLLPALNTTKSEADRALEIIQNTLLSLTR